MAVGSECYSLKSQSMLITENFPPFSFFPSLLFHFSFFPLCFHFLCHVPFPFSSFLLSPLFSIAFFCL